MNRFLLLIVAFLAVASAQRCSEPLSSVPYVELARYEGPWYEIGTSMFVYRTFERNCVCVKANYTILADESGAYVGVNNVCNKFTPDGRISDIDGRADILDSSKPGELAVSFGPEPATSPNYFIIELGPERDYGWVLVGEPCRRSLWILSRSPLNFPQETYDYLLDVARKNGFDPEAIGFRKTTQEGCWD